MATKIRAHPTLKTEHNICSNFSGVLECPAMWPFRRHVREEKKGGRLIKRLVVGLIIGGAIGSIVGSKVLDKHRREQGVDKDED